MMPHEGCQRTNEWRSASLKLTVHFCGPPVKRCLKAHARQPLHLLQGRAVPVQAVATYIESLKRASASAPPARPKTGIRVDFGGGEGPTVALASASATSSVMSSTGSFMQSDPMSAISGGGGSAPTAATAVSAYMAALKQRANTAAAAGYGSGGQGGQGNAAAGGVVHAASAPDAKSAVDAYLAGLKSRSAQAAMLRQLSSSTAGSSRASSMAVSFSG